MNNIFLGPDADLRFQLAQLRQMKASGKIENGLKLLPNVEFHYDDVTKIQGSYKATRYNLVHIDVTPQKSIPRWFGLHMKLGNVALEDVMACGVICKSRAPQSITTRFCLRSGTPEGFSDAFFPKTMISFKDTSVHLDVVERARLDLPLHSTWREFILFFEPGPIDLELLDLRVFLA